MFYTPIISKESVPSSRYYSKNLLFCSRRTQADASPDCAFIPTSLMIQGSHKIHLICWHFERCSAL